LEEHGPPRINSRAEGSTRFASLARSIVYQQLAGNAAASIYAKLTDHIGEEPTPELILRSDPQDLRACGLSSAKVAAIWDLAERVDDGRVSLQRIGRLSDDEVVEHLIQVRGVGRWTAEMFLLFTLRRMDVWPVGDLGVRNGFAIAWGLPEVPDPKVLMELGEPFRPYRSVVAWYCWRAADGAKKSAAAANGAAAVAAGGATKEPRKKPKKII
jgi:3-methyladenine DNA glycosylase/8-oxoguanine DNA glycosylase